MDKVFEIKEAKDWRFISVLAALLAALLIGFGIVELMKNNANGSVFIGGGILSGLFAIKAFVWECAWYMRHNDKEERKEGEGGGS